MRLALLRMVVTLPLMVACARIDNAPVNLPLSVPSAAAVSTRFGPQQPQHETLIAVTLSGGGTRAAAFGWGALSRLAEIQTPHGSLARDVRAVAGVSAGAILGAHFVLSGPSGLPAFRERFLERDVQSALRASPTPENLLRAAQGGINDRSGLPTWLADNLFGSATLGDLDDPARPRLIFHATDMQNRSPYLFDRRSFDAVCSGRDSFPLSEAIAASAAVPVLFAPVIIRNFGAACAQGNPRHSRVKHGVQLTSLDRHGARSLHAYRQGNADRFIKLNDGGLVDNLGVGTLMTATNLAGYASAPFALRETDQARDVMFLVVDGSTRNGRGINLDVEGPVAITSIAASVDAMIDTASRRSVDAMGPWSAAWRSRVIADRCARGLPRCADLTVRLVRIALEDMTEDSDIDRFAISTTSLRLTSEDVAFFAGKGRELLEASPIFRAFVKANARVVQNSRNLTAGINGFRLSTSSRSTLMRP
jgi:predicted acylesterase/phospholipase RssA